MKLEAEGEDGMMHSVLSQLPVMVADGQQETESDVKPQSTPRVGRSTSALHSTTIIPSSRQSLSRSGERSSTRAPPESGEHSVAANSKPTEGHNTTTLARGAKADGDLPSESVRAPSPAPSEARSTVATTLADATSRATTPFPDPELRTEATHSDIDEKASVRDSTASPTTANPDGIPISSLLRAADELYEKYPPTDPSIAADTILGPHSVIFTWGEKDHVEGAVNGSCLPSDDEAEKMVEDKSLVVLPYDPMDDLPPEEKKPVKKIPVPRKPSRALQSTLAYSMELFLKLDKRTILAGVIAMVAIGVATYEARSGGKLRKFASQVIPLLLSLTDVEAFVDLAGEVLPRESSVESLPE